MTKRLLALSLSLLLLFAAACAPAAPDTPDTPDVPDTGATNEGPDSALQPPVPPERPDLPETGDGGLSSPEDAPPAGENGASEDAPAEEGPRTVDPERPMVALTYDDGPHKEYTDQILDILEENRAVATFFEVGRSLYNDADAVRRAEALGCEVGSHSYRHADLGKLSGEAILADLDKADANFVDVLGHKPSLLRPPYGSLSRTLHSATGRSLIAWSIDTEDWLSRDVDKILASVQGAGDLNGQVILMHSTYDTSVQASRLLIPWLIQEGYQLVTVTELIELHYGDTLQPNGLYNFEYFHFGRSVSLPAAAPAPVPVPETPPAEQPDPPAGEEPPAEEPPEEELPEQGPSEGEPPEGEDPAGEEPSEESPGEVPDPAATPEAPPAIPSEGPPENQGE